MTHSDLEQAVRDVLAELTGMETAHLSADQNLEQAIGLDSLGRLELLAAVEDRFDLFLVDVETEEAATIAGMVGIVALELKKTGKAA